MNRLDALLGHSPGPSATCCSASRRWRCSRCRCGTPGTSRSSPAARRSCTTMRSVSPTCSTRDGARGLTAYINARVGMQIAGERILLLTDAAYRPLAGNLPAWPQGDPRRAPARTRCMADLAGQPTHTLLVRTTLPGGYHLLVGRDLARFLPLERRFPGAWSPRSASCSWSAWPAAILIRRELLARVARHPPDGLGHHAGRPAATACRPARSDDELNTLSQHHQRHARSDRAADRRHPQRLQLHRARPAHAARRAALAPGGAALTTRPPPAETFAEIDAAVADVDRVIRIFNALLRLAEIDTGVRRSGFVPVDAAAVAAEVVEFYEPAAEQKGVAVLVPRATGSRRSRAIRCCSRRRSATSSTTRSSACRRARRHQRARRRAAPTARSRSRSPTTARASPAADKPKATERFFRGDASRGSPGRGPRPLDRGRRGEAARRRAAAARQPSGPARPDGAAGYCRAVESMN